LSWTEKANSNNRYSHRDATMILIAYRHGLRASEVCDLQWQQNAVLRVRKSHLQRTGNFPPGVSGFCGTSLQGNPDGHGKAPIRQ